MSNSTIQKREWNVVELLKWGTGYFSEKGVSSPRLSMEWLLAHILKVPRLNLYIQFDRPVTDKELKCLKPLLLRRASKEPLQYITGETDFHHVKVAVNPTVLIPRPETEQLVEIILEKHGEKRPLRFLDIGTGSGCIALAIKKARPKWEVTAIDICHDAIKTAKKNAESNGLDIAFHTVAFEKFTSEEKFHVIASNPPYIEPKEVAELPAEVFGFEPEKALIAPDVTALYLDLFDFCHRNLDPSGTFYFEINEQRGDFLLEKCMAKNFKGKLIRDYASKGRFISGSF